MENIATGKPASVFQKWNKVLSQENKVLQQEINELKEKLQQAEAKIQDLQQLRSPCCHTMQEHQRILNNLKKKHEEETQRLNIKYEFEMHLAEKKLDQAQKELQEQKHLWFQGEYEKVQVVEFAQTLHSKLKKMEKVSKGHSANPETSCKIPMLQNTLKKEKKLRVRAGPENLEQFKGMEALSEQMDQEMSTEQDPKAQAKAGKQKAEEIAQTLFDKFKDVDKEFKESPTAIKLDDWGIITLDIQQLEKMLRGQKKVGSQALTENLNQLQTVEAVRAEMDQELKKEREHRAQAEAEKQEAVEIAQTLLQKLEEVEKTSKERSAEVKKDDQEKLEQLENLLLKERRLRLKAEKDISDHVENVSIFCREINQEIKRVRNSLARTEAARQKAVEEAQTLLKKLEEVEKSSKQCSPSE